MAPEAISELLRIRFVEAIEQVVLGGAHPYVTVAAGSWPAVARFLRDEPRLRFNLLRSITALDLMEQGLLAAVYDVCTVPDPVGERALACPHVFAVRVLASRGDPHIPSVADVWPTAEWHEREAYDLMGIVFDGNPDLRRILCPDDWEGHALRKDYVFPKEYHGIPGTTEWEMPDPRH